MKLSPWRLTGWICVGVIVVSVAACILLAALRSRGLTAVKVTALDGFPEPRDHHLPLVKQKEALPDYELSLILHSGSRVCLGAKPDTSAARGLVWLLRRRGPTGLPFAWRQGLAKDPLPLQEGHVNVPTKPGLGIEVNEEVVRKYAV